MTISRYDKRNKFNNTSEQYEDSFDLRDVKSIVQYETPKFKYAELNKKYNFTYVYHTWKYGDRLYKLADQHYGSSELWWAIAFFNQKPTESHISIGDTVIIPLPLDKLLKFIGV